MSAPNFAKVNTSKYYVFGLNKYIDEEAIKANDWPTEWLGDYDEGQTEADFEWSLEGAKQGLKEKGWDMSDGYDHDRSYPGVIFATKEEWLTVAGVTIKIEVNALTRSGRYEGATFDVGMGCIEVYDRDDDYLGEYDTISESDVIGDNFCRNRGMSRIQAKNIARTVEDAIAEAVAEAEEVFTMHAEKELVCIGVFSNGEAIYGDVTSERNRIKAAIVEEEATWGTTSAGHPLVMPEKAMATV